MRRATKGIIGICLCHIVLLFCQRASSSPVETRCAVKSRYEQFWRPVNELANKLVSIFFKCATVAFHWVPGLQAAYLRPACVSPVVAAPLAAAPFLGARPAAPSAVPVVAEPATAGYCCVKRPVPADKGYFKYDYQD